MSDDPEGGAAAAARAADREIRTLRRKLARAFSDHSGSYPVAVK
jgi:hypothetical protein